MQKKKFASGLLFVCVLAGAAVLPQRVVAWSAAGQTDKFVETFDIIVSAGEGCSGEDVHIFGTLDITLRTTVDGRGNTHVMFHLTPHLTGVGLSSGRKYNPVGPSNTNDYIDADGPRVSSGINIINLISPGSTDNLILREQYHLTVTPDGDVTADFDGVRGSCRG